MTQIIQFPGKVVEHLVVEPVANNMPTSIKVPEIAVARLAAQAVSCVAAAQMDLSLCVRNFHEGKFAEVSTETVTSVVEALRLAIYATGCRNQDRALIAALCTWSESTKGERQ